MKRFIALLTLFVVLISGCSFFKKDPQKAVQEGVLSFSDVKKLNSKMTISGTIQAPQGEKPSKVRFTLVASGTSDMSDAQSPKVDMKFELSASLDDQGGSGVILFRTIDKKMFINLQKLEIPGEAGASLSKQLASVFNTWWSLPQGEKAPFEKLADQQKDLKEKLKANTLFVNPVESGEEEVFGVQSVKYRTELSKDSLKKIIVDLARITGNQFNAEEEAALIDSLNDVEFSGAVWIGDDDLLHRLAGTISVQPKQGPSSSFDVDYSAGDFGKNVEIAAPESSKEFNPLVMLPLIGAFGSLNQTAPAGGSSTGPIDSPLGAEQVAPKK